MSSATHGSTEYREYQSNQASAHVSAGRPMLNPEGTTPIGADPTPSEPYHY
jgi:hypothetical protein